ncbi:MAG: superoxide dismutase family protein [Algibacter sp.]|uniref:superoxide dismutase family protein n=1 Tax=Algibacter sp. TaxID=1872428 RepID=UPI00262B37D8|nr:superoxide dismutase family protein [Algibacter sp.]MDG1728815.1 superoxide dismutase family protein [Algibacter sp.]MDG2177288.1 superoxide dismutase family protein [Algibacter sp.]
MKKLSILLIALAIGFTSCKKEKKEVKTVETEVIETAVTAPKKIKIALNAKSGSSVSGNVVFKEAGGEVSMTAIISGLTPGEHAIHIHASSDCSSPDGKSAGGHWNPTAQPHGKWGAETGFHKGDIGNFTADENGNGTISFTTDEWCIGCGDATKDILGKGIIVHAGVDDLTSQPSGAAGARVSCAGIIQ